MIKQLCLEIIEKIGCSKSVRPSIVIYIMYILRTDFEHSFSQLFRVRVVLSRWNFYEKCFCLEKNVEYSKLVKTIPLNSSRIDWVEIFRGTFSKCKEAFVFILLLLFLLVISPKQIDGSNSNFLFKRKKLPK